MDANELVTVLATSDPVTAHIVANDLRGEGIVCTVSGDTPGLLLGVMGVEKVEVAVHASDADRARRIIEDGEKERARHAEEAETA